MIGMTSQFRMDFYLTYMSKWPDLFFTEGAPNGDLVGFGVGKIEGDPNAEKPDYRGHVSVLTIAPEYRRARFSLTFMKFIEDVSEKVYVQRAVLFVETTPTLSICLSAKTMIWRSPCTESSTT